MNLREYIQGQRYGKNANLLEQKAMEDPFLHEALEGYDSVFSNHIDSIDRVEKKIREPLNSKKHNKFIAVYVALGVCLLSLAYAAYVFNGTDKPNSDSVEIAPNTETANNATDFTIQVPSAGIDENTDFESQENEQSQASTNLQTNKSVNQQNTKQQKSSKQNSKAQEIKSLTSKITNAESKSAEQLQIKTISTLSKTANPLYIVDGVIVSSIEHISPSEIKTKKVLRNAAQTKPYGAKGVNGVIIISTNKSKQDGSIQETFGEKEFKKYFKKNASKTADKNQVKVSFKIGKSQKPFDIRFENLSSVEAKDEALRVILNSPKWTDKVGETVSMRISW